MRLSKFKFFLLLLTLAGGFFVLRPILASDLSITEVQITGGAGHTANDYIKIHNNTNNILDLSGYRLVKRTKAGTSDTSIKSWTDPTPLNPGGYYLWANSADGFAAGLNADASTTATLAEDNSIAIRQGPADTGTIIDALSWGETSSSSLGLDHHVINPADGKIIISFSSDQESDDAPQSSGAIADSTAADPEKTADSIEAKAKTPSAKPKNFIIITEIYPNPWGADNDEFIELYNKSDQEINLLNYKITLDNQAPYIFGETKLAAKKYLLLHKKQTNLNLQNNKNTLKLYNAASSTQAIDSLSYKNAPEGQSYNLDETNKWSWSIAKTPGEDNKIIPANQEPEIIIYAPTAANKDQLVIFDGSDSFDPEGQSLKYFWQFSDGSTSTLPAVEKYFYQDKKITAKLIVSDGELTSEKNINLTVGRPAAAKTAGEKIASSTSEVAGQAGSITLKGIVVVEPKIFGSQYFYVLPLDDSDQVAETVVQIYNNKQNFPKILQGDLIEATGELYNIADDLRLKTKIKNDFKILDHDYAAISKNLVISELTDQLINQILTVTGKLNKKSANTLTLSDNNQNLKINLKPGAKIATADLIVGQTYEITGLLKSRSAGLELWPRAQADIKPAAATSTASQINSDGEEDSSSTTIDLSLADTKNKTKILEYSLITAAGIILGLAIFLIKTKIKK